MTRGTHSDRSLGGVPLKRAEGLSFCRSFLCVSLRQVPAGADPVLHPPARPNRVHAQAEPQGRKEADEEEAAGLGRACVLRGVTRGTAAR